MGIEKNIASEKYSARQQRPDCRHGLHRIIVMPDGADKGICAYCNDEVELDGQYQLVSTAWPPTYQLKTVYAGFEDELRRFEEAESRRKAAKFSRKNHRPH